MKAVMGMIPDRKGSIRFGGTELIGMPSNKIARLGLAFCPEERGIFSNLNVLENLTPPAVVKPGGMRPEEISQIRSAESRGGNRCASTSKYGGYSAKQQKKK